MDIAVSFRSDFYVSSCFLDPKDYGLVRRVLSPDGLQIHGPKSCLTGSWIALLLLTAQPGCPVPEENGLEQFCYSLVFVVPRGAVGIVIGG